jgi:chemotaxis protein histidine kinase CheA
MSDLEAIQNVLARAARRRRSQSAWNGLWQGLFIGAAIWLVALGTYKLAPIPSSILFGAAALALLCVAAGFLRGWFHKSSLLQTARCVDDRQRLQERMSTALELAGSGGDENWRALLVADAARFAGELDPRKIFPYHLPRTTRWALLVLALGAGLGFMPEYRSKDYLARQQDTAAIKDAGKRIVEITHRSLEQRPPVLEATHKAIESAEELGLRLDKNPLTRNEALKDLANVAEKLKSQLKDLGQKDPEFKAMEREARDATPSKTSGSLAEQKQLDALQKSLEKSGETPAALDKLANDLQKLQKAMAGLPKDHSPASDAARQKMAQNLADLAKQAAALGQPMPNLDDAIAALKANKPDDFQKDMNAATTDLEKTRQMAKTLQQLQQQSEKTGRDLPEQLKLGQAEAAQQTLQKMVDQLKSANSTSDQLRKMLDEVSRSVDPATPYGKAAGFLKQAVQQMKKGDKSGSAQSLADASKELEKITAEMADARGLRDSLDAVNKAETALATHRAWGECPECGDCSGRCLRAGHCLHLGKRPGGGVGTWTDDDSKLYPEMSGLWDNSGANRRDQDPRGLTDRGDPQLADNLAPTKLHGQIAPGSPMPSITLKGVSIKGQSAVGYQEAVTAAQNDAQSALNQDQVPRAYQGTVKDYFDDLKK